MEYFKPVLGFNGLYEVSNYGNVRSVDRMLVDKYGNYRNFKGKNLVKTKSSKGYLNVSLYIGGLRYNASVHRLVAEAFIPNPNEKPNINHIDAIKINNHMDNLEWCTQIENVNHAKDMGLLKKTRKGKCKKGSGNHRNVIVLMFDKNEKFKKEFYSIKNASDKMGISYTAIINALYGRSRSAGGYLWKVK